MNLTTVLGKTMTAHGHLKSMNKSGDCGESGDLSTMCTGTSNTKSCTPQIPSYS